MSQLNKIEERVCASVMTRISRRNIFLARMKAAFSGVFFITALASLVPAIQYVMSHAASSGFNDYVSLIISDGSHLSGSWSSLMLSMAESVPLVGIILTLGAITLATYCAQKFASSRHFLAHSLSNSLLHTA